MNVHLPRLRDASAKRSLKPSRTATQNFFLGFVFLVVAGVTNVPPIVVYFALAGAALFRRNLAVTVLFLVFTVNIGSDYLFPGGDALGRWVVVIALAIPFLVPNSKAMSDPALRMLLLLVGYLFVSGFFVSKMQVISLLKTFSFGLGVMAVLTSCLHIQRDNSLPSLVSSWFLCVAIASVLVWVLGGGFERNSRGFQGALAHPQLMGSVAAVGTAWFLGRWLFGKSSFHVDGVLGLIYLGFSLASQSRTGVLGVVLALGLALLLKPGRAGVKLSRGGSASALLVALVVAMGWFAINGGDAVQQFLAKGKETELDVANLLISARGELMSRSMQNFGEHPFLGIGLGVPSEFEAASFIDRRVVYVAGVPVSASVEKGFLPTAMLEEMGLIGTGLTLVLLGVMAISILGRGEVWVVWVFFTALLQNAGEAVLFSLGGKGLFIWLMLGICYAVSTLRLSRREASAPAPVSASQDV